MFDWISEYSSFATPDNLLLDSVPNLGPLISRWEINEFENCWYKSVRILEVLKFLFQQFLNLSSSQRDMSGPILGALSNNRWSWGTVSQDDEGFIEKLSVIRQGDRSAFNSRDVFKTENQSSLKQRPWTPWLTRFGRATFSPPQVNDRHSFDRVSLRDTFEFMVHTQRASLPARDRQVFISFACTLHLNKKHGTRLTLFCVLKRDEI